MNLSFFKQTSNGMKVSIRNKYSGFTRLNFTPKNYGGFTIVELLVVIVIIGVLATVTIVSYTGISQKAIAVSLQSDLSGAKKQLALYYVDYGFYPITAPTQSGNTYCTNDTKYCYKASLGNTIRPYTPADEDAPQSYTLDATNTNTTTYRITNNSIPTAYSAVACTGGTVTTDGLYTVHKFTSIITSSLECSGSITGAEVLIVAGGGGGRSNPGGAGSGGGGAGGLIASTVSISGTMPVIVGNGGSRDVGNGGNSSFASLTAIGGGMGGYISAGNAGGSGGGSSWNNIGGVGTNGQGHNGAAAQNYAGGGGGGAEESGGLTGVPGGYVNEYYPGKGGAGINSDIVQDGVNVGYAGGGGGGSMYGTSSTATHGGGYSVANNNATSGTANTGGGGGGGHQGYAGGSGGTGIVIVRYLTQ